MRLRAYENAAIYKEKRKKWYDKKLLKKEFKEGDRVLPFNSRFRLFGKGKLRSKWEGPYLVNTVLSSGAVIIMDGKRNKYTVNGQCLKVYLEPDTFELKYFDVYFTA